VEVRKLMAAYSGSYVASDLPLIFIDLVGRIGVALVENISLLVGGIILTVIITIYLGLPQKAMGWLKHFSKH
jgi:hypothetical protein